MALCSAPMSLTPQWLQSYMGYTPTWSGMTTAWSGTTAVLMAPIASLLMAKKLDPRGIVFFGLMWIAAVMFLRTHVTVDVTYWQIAIPLILMGVGLPLFFVPLTTLALGSVEEREDRLERRPAELSADDVRRHLHLTGHHGLGKQDNLCPC